MADQQNYKNHVRVVPMYHVGVFFPLLANFVWALYRLWNGPSGDDLVNLALAGALLLMFLSVRVQILTVQDRVIRLEMRLRLRALLPVDMRARAETIPAKQLAALRFAGDAELPILVREVLDGSLTTGKEIKIRVRDWQPDHLRA